MRKSYNRTVCYRPNGITLQPDKKNNSSDENKRREKRSMRSKIRGEVKEKTKQTTKICLFNWSRLNM
jgi:hypothetical protein